MKDEWKGARVICFGCFTTLVTVYLLVLAAILLFKGQVLACFALCFIAVTSAAVGTVLFGKLETWLRGHK